MGFKEIGSRIVGNWSGCDGGFCGVVGAIPSCGSVASIFLQLRFNLASKTPQSSHVFRLDQPRSRHDQATIVAWMLRRLPSEHVGNSPLRFHTEGGTIAARSHRDRGSIAPRLWSSSTSSLCRSMRIM